MKELNRNQKGILDLLSRSLLGKEINLPASINWNTVYEESISQAVLPLIYRALLV